MIETAYDVLIPLPTKVCEKCGEPTKSQIYTLTQDRPKLTREWQFCSLGCLRSWAAPVR